MVRELKAMSAQAGHRTLTGLLDLAYQEALLRRRVGRVKDAGGVRPMAAITQAHGV